MTFHFDDITVMFLLWVLVLHPAAAWRGYKRLARGEPIGSKVYRFRLSLYVIVCSTLIALAVAVTRQLALPWAASVSSLTFGLMFSAALVVSVTLQHKKVDPAQQERIRLLYAPTGTTEWILGVWVGLCAGVGEEIVYRAVLFQIIAQVTSSAAMALLVCVLAFALAQFVGRGAGAGIAGFVTIAGFIVNGYQAPVPELGPIADLTWFGWTVNHVPLAGQFDWPSVAFLAVFDVILLAIGVWAFVRRDLGATSSVPTPSLPRALVGLRGPFSRRTKSVKRTNDGHAFSRLTEILRLAKTNWRGYHLAKNQGRRE
jgi:membrane protease YdiL (CAAX protease family)